MIHSKSGKFLLNKDYLYPLIITKDASSGVIIGNCEETIGCSVQPNVRNGDLSKLFQAQIVIIKEMLMIK